MTERAEGAQCPGYTSMCKDQMDATEMTLEEIRLAGLRALSRDLGAVGLVRFLQQFETGYGDYTAERHRWTGE